MWPRTDSGVGSSAAPARGTRGVGSSEMDFGKAPLGPRGKCLALSTVQVSHPAASPPRREGDIPRSSFLLAEVPSLALGFLWPCSYVLLLSFDFSPLLSWEEKREEQQRFRAPQTLAWREQCYGWDLPATPPHPGANPPHHLSGHNQPPVPTSHGSRFFHHEAFPGPLHQTICFPSLPVYGNPPAHACPGLGLLGFHT